MISDPDKLFRVKSNSEFEEIAIQIFHYQAQYNKVYREYLSHLGTKPQSIQKLEQIPFLPIQFFKSKQVYSGQDKPELVFHSSGTTGSEKSKHYIIDASLYQRSFSDGFRYFYKSPEHYHVLALLPSYLEQEHSSLIFMAHSLIEQSASVHGGFYLYDPDLLLQKINDLKKEKDRQILLLGVSYALLDLAMDHEPDLSGMIVMETGGMKGRRKELVREELHEILCQKFNVEHIHSEYGMTELLSQAYSFGSGLFRTPPWMKVLIRDIYDPFSIKENGRTGGINIIDLANIHSCSFIETQDLGSLFPDGSFTVQGRYNNSEIRGCNLLVD